ncbi:polysaccharide deacetylase family protein [Carboxylicivirga sp. N1Y90]|uniref:polysaccharide deacetylase family protein n=1 Tax=Carboxylicivirga fragile TaxID=3417571 RepID=UPI003D350896|nr:polysaccharide deacetylase family protein [Marinilabiliaceae bacterium N1Y90]
MTRFGKVYRGLVLFFFLSVGIIVSLNAWQKEGNKKEFSVTGLVYHRFGDERYPSTNTTVKQFEEQLEWLKQNGYQTLTTSEAYVQINKGTLGEKVVCITVDDGYRSFMENGLPILEKYGMKATLFVNTESVGWADYLTWQELRDIQSRGVEIGNHSHKHSYFMNKSHSDFELDLSQSEKLFKDELGMVPKSYAYPYGEFSEAMADVLRAKGYQAGFAQFSGVWTEKTNSYSVPRFPMSGTNISLERFVEKVKMKQLFLQGISTYPIVVNSGKSMEFKFAFNTGLYAEPFNCFVNGQPVSNSLKDKGVFTINIEKMPARRRSTLTVTTRNVDGAWCWHSSLLLNSTIEE